MAREDGIVGGSPAAAAPAGGATAAARHDATPNAWLDDCFAAAEAQLAALLRTGGSSHVPCSRQAGPLPVNSLPGVVVKAALAAHPNSKPDRIAAHCNGRQCNPPIKHAPTSIRAVAEAAAMSAMPAAARTAVLLAASA